jgi:hypothetical protein
MPGREETATRISGAPRRRKVRGIATFWRMVRWGWARQRRGCLQRRVGCVEGATGMGSFRIAYFAPGLAFIGLRRFALAFSLLTFLRAPSPGLAPGGRLLFCFF